MRILFLAIFLLSFTIGNTQSAGIRVTYKEKMEKNPIDISGVFQTDTKMIIYRQMEK
jgi:hypothetical protein